MEDNKPQRLERISEKTVLLNPDGSVAIYLNLSPEQLVRGRGQIVLNYAQIGNKFMYNANIKPVNLSQVAPEVKAQFYSQPGLKAISAKEQLNRLFSGE